MPRYRIHRIKETPREQFRWVPQTSGEVVVKLKDYEPGATVEAPNPYAAWKLLGEEGAALHPGDLLEIVAEGEGNAALPPRREMVIAKYIGFDPAIWFVPEPRRVEVRSGGPTLSSEASTGGSTGGISTDAAG